MSIDKYSLQLANLAATIQRVNEIHSVSKPPPPKRHVKRRPYRSEWPKNWGDKIGEKKPCD